MMSTVFANQRRWVYRGGQTNVTLPGELLKTCQGSSLLARLLYNRDISTQAQAQAFLTPAPPYRFEPATDLPDFATGVEAILAAIDREETILVYGDFDVDGITGTSILYETLKRLKAKVSTYIPDRAAEGHGLNTAACCKLASTRQPKLVITTDTGISNFAEISLLKSLGIATIVTDHHELPDNLPPSIANINPLLLNTPDHPLGLMCGAGVAFKVCEALLHAKLPPDEAHEASERLLDLVAIGTVADMVPLQRANRTLVQQGLRVLQRRQRVGINAMLQLAGVDPEATLTSETIGFTLGPRLNALGRLSNAAEAVTLLTTHNPDEARPIAEHLEVLNKKRQTLCDTTFEQAQHLLQTTGGVDGRKVIILGHEGWNPGVIGIVASRLIETYHRPTLLMVLQPDQHKARGSARSIPGFHLAKALEGVSDLLLHHGGHAGAAGFALEMQHLAAFKQRLQTMAERDIPDEWLVPTVEVDCKLTFEQLTPGLLELQENLAPFGMGNPAPLFALENASIASQKALGTEAQHLKLMLQPPNAKGFTQGIEALWWRAGAGVSVDASQPYHVAFTAEANNTQYGGGPVRLTLKALQPSKPTANPLPLGEGAAITAGEGRHKTETPYVSFVDADQPSPQPSPKGRGSKTLTPALSQRERGLPKGEGVTMAWHDARSPETAELPDVGNVSDTALATRLQSPDSNEPWLLYNEGRAPNLPLWPSETPSTQEPAGVINRLTASPCHTLLLWDIPPTPALTHALMATCQPRHVVLMGRKYDDVPLKLEAVTFLKGLYQGLRRLPPAHQPASAVGGLTLEQIACRFATTPELVALCLSLYERLGLAVLAPQAETLAVAQWVEAPVAWANVAQRHASDVWLLQRLIDEVAAWRTWVRQAQLSALQRVVASAVLHVTQPLLISR